MHSYHVSEIYESNTWLRESIGPAKQDKGPKHHPQYYLEDGNIVFLVSEYPSGCHFTRANGRRWGMIYSASNAISSHGKVPYSMTCSQSQFHPTPSQKVILMTNQSCWKAFRAAISSRCCECGTTRESLRPEFAASSVDAEYYPENTIVTALRRPL